MLFILFTIFGMNISLSSAELPSDFPVPIITANTNPSSGYYFCGMMPGATADTKYFNYLMVLDSLGSPFIYKKVGAKLNQLPMNFMQSPNGLLVYTIKTPTLGGFFIADSTLKTLDSINNTTSFVIFPYFQLMPNGHYMVILFEYEPYDLSKVFIGGDPNASIRSSTIYELDRDKNIVFKWRSLDNFNLKDSYEDTLAAAYATPHTNNIFLDYDGNYLLSSRHLSEITKLNSKTGDIIWRLGGKNNQFSFLNEHEENAPNYFSYQHDIRRLSNGNISIFDNGTQHKPNPYSRGAEYKLDEVNKTATLVWEYRPQPDIYAVANGSCQTMPNGNRVIGWGEASGSGSPGISELNPDNSLAFEIFFQSGFKSMRAEKHPFIYNKPSAKIVGKEVLQYNTYKFEDPAKNIYTCVEMTMTKLEEIFYSMIDVYKYEFSPLHPDFEEESAPFIFNKRLVIKDIYIKSFDVEVRFNASCLGITYKPEEYKVYRRDTVGIGKFVQLPTVYDSGTGDLVINTTILGEFIFGIPQKNTKPATPAVISPENQAEVNQNLPVKLDWIPKGYFTASHIQLSKDVNFTTTLVNDTIKSINFTLSSLESGSTYYWRVRSFNGTIPSDWSEIFTFKPSAPFIKLITPVGGERLIKDSIKKIIRWNKNISSLVKIELLKNGEFNLLIKDSLNSPTGGFAWKIPTSVLLDSNYKIRISSLTDNNLISVSEDDFAIIADPTDVNDLSSENSGIIISNYPNPFNNSTTFEFSIKESGKTIIRLYDINGKESKVIYSDYLESGLHRFIWTFENSLPGAYLYEISVGNKSKTGKLIYIK
jgi:hypothetical protein